MFEYIYILPLNYIYCLNFKANKSLINKKQIIKLINIKNSNILEHQNHLNKYLKKLLINNLDINIIKNLIDFIEKNIIFYCSLIKLLISNSEDNYVNKITIYLHNLVTIDNKKLIDNLTYNKFIIEKFKRIYIPTIISKNKIINQQLIKISANIKSIEGKFILNIISKYKCYNCIEIGMANGVSSLYILTNLNTKLISIDPFQESQWKNIGIKLLKYHNMSNRHELIQEKSYIALPSLLQIYKENKFNFIFIDGFHTFDYTLIDFFYSDLLLEINGYIIIDDALHKGVAKCIKYLKSNYKHYIIIKSPNTICVLKKIANDNRKWDFHINF
jgi:predicted O-methyltransferase YrrM